MKATKKEISEYKKEAKAKYGIETTYIIPGATKKQLNDFRKRNIRYHRKENIKSILKGIWSFLPLRLFITIFARIGIATTAITYLDSQGSLSFFMNIALFLWMIMPLRSFFYDAYYGCKEYFALRGKKE